MVTQTEGSTGLHYMDVTTPKVKKEEPTGTSSKAAETAKGAFHAIVARYGPDGISSPGTPAKPLETDQHRRQINENKGVMDYWV